MKTCKPSDGDLEILQGIAATLKAANAKAAEATKAVEAAKEQLAKWLREKRDCEIETLLIGDMVQIEGVVLIEIASQRRFDEKSFQLEEAKLHEQYMKNRPVKKFKPLV